MLGTDDVKISIHGPQQQGLTVYNMIHNYGNYGKLSQELWKS